MTPRPRKTNRTEPKKHARLYLAFQDFFSPIRKRRGFLLLFLLLCGAWPELILHIASAKSASTLTNCGLFLAPLLTVATSVTLYGLTCVIPKRGVNMALSMLYGAFSLVLCGAQVVYYHIFGYFFSFYSMRNGAQAMQFYDVVIETILTESWLVLLVMAIPFVLLCAFGFSMFSYKAVERRQRWKAIVLSLVAAAAFHGLLVASLPLWDGSGDLSAQELYKNDHSSYSSVNKLGAGTALRLEVQRSVFGSKEQGSIQLPVTTAPTASTSATQATQDTTEATRGSSEPSTEATTEATEPTIDTSPNVLNIDFDALMEMTESEQVKTLHALFASRTPSSKNEKTGLFEGCNLIQITAEGFSHLVIDPELTPTLYKMQTEGFYFTNYYVPSWGASTIDGEYVHLTGTIPKSGVWSFRVSKDNYMPLTMSMQLLAQGYSSRGYHNHTYNYYDRNLYLENLGMVYKGYGNGLDIDYMWPSSDYEMVDITTDEYVLDQPFYTYYMTVSGHLNYNFYGNNMCARNKALTDHLDYSEAVRAYLSCQLELEKAMTLLLERLEEAGVLENTVIVITADHYPYGLTNDEISELAGHQVDTDFELYRNALIIYKAGMEPEVIDEPCCSLDVLPTLSNLFGLEFDSRLYMGRDIFSDADPLVIFSNHSWITDKGSYDRTTGTFTPAVEGEEVSEEYIQSVSTDVSNRFTASTWILETDYWSYLFEEPEETQ